jgi:hypothetical protein
VKTRFHQSLFFSKWLNVCCRYDEEELSADEDEDILARYATQLGGHGALVLDATTRRRTGLDDDSSSDED